MRTYDLDCLIGVRINHDQYQYLGVLTLLASLGTLELLVSQGTLATLATQDQMDKEPY